MRILPCLSVFIFGMSVLQILIPQVPWAAQSYTIQELGVVDAIRAAGPNGSGTVAVRSGFVAATSSRISPGGRADKLGILANGINDLGDVVDSATSSRMAPGGAADNRGILASGDYASANGINDAGDAVGSANTMFGSRPCREDIPGLVVDDLPGIEKPFRAPPPGNCPISTVRAVLWKSNGGFKYLRTLPGDSASEAFAINNQGTVVGYSSGPKGVHAVAWAPDGGKADNLGTLPGGNTSKAFGISDTGLIVGSSRGPVGTRAVLWKGNRIQDIGTLPGDMASEAHGVNSSGSIVGDSHGPNGMRAFVWTSGNGMKAHPALPGGTSASALAISELGEIAGSAEGISGLRAVLWSNTHEPQDLNTLVSLPPGMVLMQAVGINTLGQIVALGRDQKNIHANHEGPSRVFLLTRGGP